MKNIFTINIETKQRGRDAFLIRRADGTLKAQYDEKEKWFGEASKKRVWPLAYLSYFFLICGALFCILFAIKGDDRSFAQAHAAFGWALYVGIAGIVLGVAFLLAARIRLRKLVTCPQALKVAREADALEEEIAKRLCVPEDSAELDILCLPYTLKKGKEEFQDECYDNLPMRVFVEDGNLCFADVVGVWGFPLSAVTAIVPCRERVKISAWNKEEACDAPQYRQTVKVSKGECVVQGYYSLQSKCGDEEWEVLIPAYDGETICALIGKPPAA